MLTGISETLIVRVRVSTINMNNPPVTAARGMSFRFDGPTNKRPMWGIINPIQPIVPATQTEAAVSSVAQLSAMLRTSVTFVPNVRASVSPIDKTSIHHDIHSSKIIGRIIIGAIITNSLLVT